MKKIISILTPILAIILLVIVIHDKITVKKINTGWHADVYGIWWVKSPDGNFYGDPKKERVVSYGSPFNR